MKKLTPTVPLHNASFQYTPSHATNIKKRFEAERKKIQAEKENKVVRLK